MYTLYSFCDLFLITEAGQKQAVYSCYNVSENHNVSANLFRGDIERIN